MNRRNQASSRRGPLSIKWVVGFALTGLGLAFFSCDGGALNPAFVNVIDPDGSSGLNTVANSPGHVVVSLLNDTVFDERLTDWLAPQLGLSEAEVQALVPRVRMRVQITFADGSSQVIEFVDGTRSFVQPGFDAQSVPDLNQNDLNHVVARCDVARVEAAPGSPIEVFMPVELIGFELVEGTGPGGGTVNTYEERTQIAPAFIDLQVDDVDEDGDVILRRNVDVRDTVTPVANVLCGSVIGIKMSGVLTAPFLDVASDAPSFDIDDENTIAGIGGRFEFNVSVQ